MQYFLGIDNGGTSIKAGVYDASGRVCASAVESTPVICHQPGFAECSMETMWSVTARTVRQAVGRSGVRPGQISGIACCGHGKGLYLLDAEGNPVRSGILSADTRALSYEKRWRSDGTEQQAREYSLQHIMACQPVALLSWLRDHEPENFRRIRWILSCKDYIRYRLTGKAAAELSDVSGTGLLNLTTRTYDDRLLALFHLEAAASALPPLCGSMEFCGGVTSSAAEETGLTAGTPVYGGMFDIDACALAVGATTDRELCMISGTWSINEYVSDVPVCSENIKMNSLFCLDGRYLVEESSAASAGNNEWLLKQVLRLPAETSRSVYETADDAVCALGPDADVPVCLPFIMASNVNPDAMGAFVGLSQNQDWRHFVRGVYEGVAFCHRQHYERLLQVRTRPVEEIRLAGGAAHSALWTQIFADVMNTPIRVVEAEETGTLGCAVLAAAASGAKSSVEEAVRDMVRLRDPVLPNAESVPIYEKKYRRYGATIDALDSVWSLYHASDL